MAITQQQFNSIIDLLGDAATAEAAFEAMPEELDRTELEKKYKLAYQYYLNAIAELYRLDVEDEYPTLYTAAYAMKQRNTSGFASDCQHSIDQKVWYTIDITFIETQLNNDFVVENSGDEIQVAPKKYTGKYIHYNDQGEYTSETRCSNVRHINSAVSQYTESMPSVSFRFIMDVLTHPATLTASGALLLLAGILIAAAGVSIVLGSTLAIAGGLCLTGYALHHFGFFAKTPEQPASDTLTHLNENKAPSNSA